MAPMSLPPGFRFHPTDEELVAYYLERKITGRCIELEIIPEVDLYKCEPWDLPDKSFLPSKDMEWYFYSPRDRKYPNGSRTNRATRAGYWKATGKDRPVNSQKRPIGMKKTLVYYRGRAPHGIRTYWVMHEYRLIDSVPGTSFSSLKDSYSLCRVFKKTTQVSEPKKEDQTGDAKKESMEEKVVVGEEMETLDDQKFLINHDQSNFPNCDLASSSDLTQGTPAETGIVNDFQAQFAYCDEANSAANSYSLGMDYSSYMFQDLELPINGGMHYDQLPPYSPLELEDFPQINFAEAKPMKPEITGQNCMLYDKYRDCMNGTLEEIISLCSSQDI